MVKVKSLKALRYNPHRVDIEKVMAPPYDIISGEERKKLYITSVYNIVRIDYGEEELGDSKINNKYTRARKLLEKWIEEGIFIQESMPCFYYYTQEYTFRGSRKKLSGFIGLLKIEEFGENVFPHEETLSQPKKDRLELMRHTRSNISPIYTVYLDGERRIERLAEKEDGRPLYEFYEDFSGVRIKHTLWKLCSEEALREISDVMIDKKIFIADGHHRYETALAYRMERKREGDVGETPYDYVLTFFANMKQEGITIIPAHRLLKSMVREDFIERASEYFEIEEVTNKEGLIRKIDSSKSRVIGFFSGDRAYLLKLRNSSIMDELIKDKPKVWKNLNVVVLHSLIIEKILGIDKKKAEKFVSYEIDIDKTFKTVNAGKARAAFFLKPLALEEIRDVAFAGGKMPGKATYFFPKLLTGLMLYKMD